VGDRIVVGIKGTAFDAPHRGRIRIRDEVLLLVDTAGEIAAALHPEDAGYSDTVSRLQRAGSLRELGPGQYLVPGFIDLHNHAPQWPQSGKALDVTLQEWLNTYTFPLEARYRDLDFAGEVYASLVDAMLANGTTTAVYFATAHLAPTTLLADTCLRHGQRALIGRVAMDSIETCPPFYRDPSAAIAVEETRALIEHVDGLSDDRGLIRPVVTPRFIPSCTDDLLRGLGELVEETGAHVQTHCSESDWAHEYGMDRFGQTDTATYADFGLLTRKTVLAHSNLITGGDMDTIAAAGAAVAHCPLSNVYFANAVFPLRQSLDRGVNVGLGTDISGGPAVSIMRTMTDAVVASRVLDDGVDPRRDASHRGVPGSRVTLAEAFWLGTTGGGIALDLPIGLLEPGYAFDAVAIDTGVTDSDVLVWPGLDTAFDVFQKVIHHATRRNIVSVWVGGSEVRSAAGDATAPPC
jgi:guanine deaminase